MRSRRRDGAESALDGRRHAVTAAAAPRTSSLLRVPCRRSWLPRSGRWQAAGRRGERQDELLAVFREEEGRGRGHRAAGGVIAGAHDAAPRGAGTHVLLRCPGCRARRGRRSSAPHAGQAARRGRREQWLLGGRAAARHPGKGVRVPGARGGHRPLHAVQPRRRRWLLQGVQGPAGEGRADRGHQADGQAWLPGQHRVPDRGVQAQQAPPGEPRRPHRLLRRRRPAAPRLRAHGRRDIGRPPLRLAAGEEAVGLDDEDDGGTRRGAGARVPAREGGPAGRLRGLQGLQHSPRRQLHAQALRLRPRAARPVGRRQHAHGIPDDGLLRLPRAGVRPRRPGHHEGRRLQLRRRPAAAHLRQTDRRHQQARRGAEHCHLGTADVQRPEEISRAGRPARQEGIPGQGVEPGGGHGVHVLARRGLRAADDGRRRHDARLPHHAATGSAERRRGCSSCRPGAQETREIASL